MCVSGVSRGGCVHSVGVCVVVSCYYVVLRRAALSPFAMLCFHAKRVMLQSSA